MPYPDLRSALLTYEHSRWADYDAQLCAADLRSCALENLSEREHATLLTMTGEQLAAEHPSIDIALRALADALADEALRAPGDFVPSTTPRR